MPESASSYSSSLGQALERARAGAAGTPVERLAEIRAGSARITFVARVVETEWREVKRRSDGGKLILLSGLLADDSATVRFTWWDDPKNDQLTKGEVVRIRGAEVREWQGRAEIRLSRNVTFERLKDSDLPSVKSHSTTEPTELWRLRETPGGFRATVDGILTNLLPSSGLAYRCPSCSRTLQASVCRAHGKVEGSLDLRARAVLDDGTGTLTAHFGRKETEGFLGRTLPDKDLPQINPDALFEELFGKMVGRRVRVEGRILGGEFPSVLVDRCQEVLGDTRAQAKKLLGSVSLRGKA